MASAKKKRVKPRPVTTSSKSSTPGPTPSLNLNLPLGGDADDSNIKSGPGPAPIDVNSQPTSSSSSARQPGEPESNPVLNVIGSPALPSQTSTPAPKSELKPKENGTAAASSPTPTSQPTPTVMPKHRTSTSKAPFCGDEEFIAFTFSGSDEETAAVPIREWDQGKEDRDAEKRGKKRKSGEMFRDDRDGGRERGHRDRDRDGEKRRRMENVPRRAPWVANVDWDRCTNVPELLHREVKAFVEYVSPTKAEDEVRGLIVNLITRAVVRNFPDAKVLPFGSFETKLYLPSGDLDLVIQSDNMIYMNKVTVLRALANTIKRAGIANNVTIIAKAKVPIIKFVTNHGHLSVDISVNHINGVFAGQVILGLLKEMPALRALVLIIKAFLGQRSMNEVFSGGLGSYSIVCLAVSFLQMHPKIRRGEIDPSENLGVLMMEFFELYGCYFNYQEVGISIRKGGYYFSKARRGWQDPNKPHLLSIEDPNDESNDVSKGTYGIVKVRTTFAGAYTILTSSAFLHAGLMNSRREGRYTRLRSRTAPEDMSILSNILGIPQETINHRKLLQEVYESGALHDMLGVPRPQAPPPPPPETNGSEKFNILDVYRREDGSDMDLSDYSESERYRHESGEDDEEEGESRYRMRSSRQPPAKRRKSDLYEEYVTDDDYED